MKTTSWPVPIEAPVAVPRVSITVDPLLADELSREVRFLPLIRIMQSKSFTTRTEAEALLTDLMYRTALTKGTCFQYTASEKAKALVAEAFATRHKSKKIAKAREALNRFPNCAEAYLLLAECESEYLRKVKLLERGVEIASADLDKSRFAEPDGYFWQELITRPYIRCRTALARTLWENNDKGAAVEHFRDLLRLNPYDNQGIRYHLLNWLLEHDCSSSVVDEYCSEYESDKAASVKFACALWKFARFGAGEQSHAALDAAIEANEFVVAVLCGRANLPVLTSTRVERGTAQEAIMYHHIGGNAWKGVAGALNWLENRCPGHLSDKRILQEIARAKNFQTDGHWVGAVPIEIMRMIN